ncbi:two-component sensor histidine kinase [Microbacterium nanhaiense]|uniref:histidine kinase n=1 Tax=Microbacterium nanhaiense TaxID=1301026 RepID=A0ABQ2N3H3_9MICO|nr:histidine kinase [Microbacterium nanhaiense]GGO67092.1 two-component sensor histidine kinase [Microbacterium nanhaiense]
MFRSIGWIRISVDSGIAVAFFALTAFSTVYAPYDNIAFMPLIAGFMSIALAIRRLSPGLSLAVAWFGAIVQMLLLLPPLPTNIAIFGVIYVTAAYGSRLVMWLGAASTALGALAIASYMFLMGVNTTADPYYDPADGIISTALVALFGFGLAWTGGALVRALHRAQDNRAAQRAAEAVAQAEQERGRIARDMHDVVAHSLAVVVAQANGARYAGRTDPQIALDTLATIAQTAGSALADVRMLLAQLRHREAEGPQPTIADLDALFGQIRAAGVDLRVDIDPAPRGDVPASVQLAVYRILQEALTNALRHRTGGGVDVTLAWQPGSVTVTVANDATGERHSARDGLGHGIIGMRERAALVGGSLDIEHGGDRFVVRAAIPWEGTE